MQNKNVQNNLNEKLQQTNLINSLCIKANKVIKDVNQAQQLLKNMQ